MKRRALLGTLASLALAGCTGRDAPSALPGDDPTTTAPETTDSTTQNPSTTTANDPLADRTLGAPPGQTDCPSFGDNTERVVCYPEHDDAALSLTPSTDAADLSADVTFTLANDTDTTFMTNFYGWSLWKRESDQWFHVAPNMIPQPLHTLPAGESHEWRAGLSRSVSADSGPSDSGNISVTGLGGGEYAFATDGWFEGGDYQHKVGLVARFDLRGDPVELTPTDDAESTRDGDTVTVTMDTDDSEHAEPAAFVVERADPPTDGDVRRRITEQLLRPSPPHGNRPVFRNSVPFFEDGVTTVRLETETASTPPFGVNEPYYLAYEDETYRVSAEKLD